MSHLLEAWCSNPSEKTTVIFISGLFNYLLKSLRRNSGFICVIFIVMLIFIILSFFQMIMSVKIPIHPSHVIQRVLFQATGKIIIIIAIITMVNKGIFRLLTNSRKWQMIYLFCPAVIGFLLFQVICFFFSLTYLSPKLLPGFFWEFIYPVGLKCFLCSYRSCLRYCCAVKQMNTPFVPMTPTERAHTSNGSPDEILVKSTVFLLSPL